jgi:hypothetical protein
MITVIEAQEMLKQIKVALFPNMKEQAQQKLIRSLEKSAFEWNKQDTNKKRALTNKELADLLKARM